MTSMQGLTKIVVTGFKSLVKQAVIEIRPLTLLAGANSSGKSSIMQPLLLLKQTLEAPYDPGPLLLDGPNVRFTAAEQFLSRQQNLSAHCFVSFATDNASISCMFQQNKQAMLEILATQYYDQDNNPQGPLILTPDTRMTFDEFATKSHRAEDLYKALKGISDGPFSDWATQRRRCYLEAVWEPMTADSDPLHIFHSPLQTLPTEVIHLPGLRGNPERTYKISAVADKFPGTFEHYVASLIHHWQQTNDDRLTTLTAQVQRLGLAETVQAQRQNGSSVEVKVGFSADENFMVSVADVGVGVSQVLPVLVALLVAQPGQLVYIEQPEIHLHPRAQVALAEILATAARRGVRVVAETHSSLLLLAMQTLVAEEKLAPELTMLNWFERDAQGISRISSTELDERGAFGEWPEDFGEVDLGIQSRYLDAVEMRQVA